MVILKFTLIRLGHQGKQGDSLSSCFFLLCTEVLIPNIWALEYNNKLSGLRVAQTSPNISHLFFAYGIFLFQPSKSKTMQYSHENTYYV